MLRLPSAPVPHAEQLSTMKVTVENRSRVTVDDQLVDALRPFDYPFEGDSVFTLDCEMPEPDSSWGIGLIVGPSGSGKTSLLKFYGEPTPVEWDSTLAIASQVSSEKLQSVGLNSIPSWCRPYHALSNGEAFRAYLARVLESGAVVDEFTSVVDRHVAKAVSASVSKYVTSKGLKNLVFASCHHDIIEWLQPDWVFDTSNGTLSRGRLLRRPEITLSVFKADPACWRMFGAHHYLNTEMNKSARCFIATWDGVPVGFASALAFPNGNIQNAWREHRTVILPDFQGLGLGVRLSDFVARTMLSQGKRYFSKTAHPRMGGYREASPLWRPTSKNRKARKDYAASSGKKESLYAHLHASRVCFSHEFVGDQSFKQSDCTQ